MRARIDDELPIGPNGKPHFAGFDDDRCGLCGLLFTKGEKRTVKLNDFPVIVHDACKEKYLLQDFSQEQNKISSFYKAYEGSQTPCFYCGNPVDDIDISREHLTAQSVGGTNDLLNLVLAHKKCNSIAGSHPVNYKITLRERLLKGKT